MSHYKFLQRLVLFFSVLAGFLLASHPLTTQAATDPDSGSGFTVKANLPDNQLASDAGYFDVLVKPNTDQLLTVQVINLTNHARTLTVTPTDAWTGDNGQVSYSPNKNRQPHSKVRFTKLASNSVNVDLAAHEGKPVTFTVHVPKKEFSGQVLGAIYVSDPKTVKATQSGNFKINNHYSMALAVNLQEQKDISLKPTLTLNKVKAAVTNNHAAIAANLENTKPVLFGKMTVKSAVYPQKSDRALTKITTKDYAVAPRSDFDYQIPLKNEKLKPGRYHLDLVATSGKQTWRLAKDFTVTNKDAKSTNKHIAVKHNWLWLYITIAALIALALVAFGYLFGKKRASGH